LQKKSQHKTLLTLRFCSPRSNPIAAAAVLVGRCLFLGLHLVRWLRQSSGMYYIPRYFLPSIFIQSPPWVSSHNITASNFPYMQTPKFFKTQIAILLLLLTSFIAMAEPNLSLDGLSISDEVLTLNLKFRSHYHSNPRALLDWSCSNW
jgi:hypothetical protein